MSNKLGDLLPDAPPELVEKLIEKTISDQTLPEVIGSQEAVSPPVVSEQPPATNGDLVPNGLTTIEKQIANYMVEGLSRATIATMLEMPVDTINTVGRRRHVQKYVQDAHQEIGVADKKNREVLLSQIIEARLNNMAEGDDMSSLSNKDTADLIAMLDSIQKEREKADLGNSANVVINVLQAIKK